jgi:hypothetical protein
MCNLCQACKEGPTICAVDVRVSAMYRLPCASRATSAGLSKPPAKTEAREGQPLGMARFWTTLSVQTELDSVNAPC